MVLHSIMALIIHVSFLEYDTASEDDHLQSSTTPFHSYQTIWRIVIFLRQTTNHLIILPSTNHEIPIFVLQCSWRFFMHISFKCMHWVSSVQSYIMWYVCTLVVDTWELPVFLVTSFHCHSSELTQDVCIEFILQTPWVRINFRAVLWNHNLPPLFLRIRVRLAAGPIEKGDISKCCKYFLDLGNF